MTITLSDQIQGIYGVPQVPYPATLAGKDGRWNQPNDIGNTENGDVLILYVLPANAVVTKVTFACTNLSSGTADIGVYTATDPSDATTYTAVNATCFASAIALGSGAITTPVDVTFESGAAGIPLGGEPLWQRAGLTAAPESGVLFIGLANPTGTGATGTVL